MPREAEPSLSEATFVTKALANGLRLDQRQMDQFRPLRLKLGNERGVADVECGKTRIFVKVSAELTLPFPDRPLDGIFSIAAEMGPMVAPSLEANRGSETEVLLSRILEKTIRRSGALDTESLCLVAGQKCWAVRADVHVLSLDGNLVDTACLAVVAALRHFRRRETSLRGAELTVYSEAEREPIPLNWMHSPFCVTFSFVGDEADGVLLDATWLEEQVRVASCTFSLNKHGELCQVSKLGGREVDAALFLRCARMAVDKAREFSDLVDAALAEDERRRDKGGLMAAELKADNERET
ncbi:hypothetical protein CDD80_6271 [Ophiocordyceps camponoti-rufipedis]|uniref:Uncharacterized protein n=1 Tax=Ophiocordyceps camponoti-rufipedis TaxID=2004952 RepID=A0A2C5YR04_9HYPO|nr:hypothetical protein CDD80_6271 [Ophiocordyceps camponoti-rufipedis]